MNYAGRRTWPDKSKSWEYLGAAESIEDFALRFATDCSLDANTEFVVIEKAGAESDIQFFKVSRVAPYALMPAEPRVEGAQSAGQAPPPQLTSSHDIRKTLLANARFYLKVCFTAVAFFVSAAWLMHIFGVTK
jgi:hypothetical protein